MGHSIKHSCIYDIVHSTVRHLLAAFDTLNHDALINLGFRDKSISLLKSYIENRHSEVEICSVRSLPRPHLVGFPQRSVLEPPYLTSTFPRYSKCFQDIHRSRFTHSLMIFNYIHKQITTIHPPYHA